MKITLVWMLLSVAGVAHGQSVWRCGPELRSYSESPCPEGHAVALVAARPADDLSRALDVARREKALAARLVRERHQRQAELPKGAGLAGIHGSRLAQPRDAAAGAKKSSEPKRKPRLEATGTSRAVGPSTRFGKG